MPTFLSKDPEELAAADILHEFRDVEEGGKVAYYCYLPDFAILMYSLKSRDHALSLCYKLLAQRLNKVSSSFTEAQLHNLFPTLDFERTEDHILTMKPNLEQVIQMRGQVLEVLNESPRAYQTYVH